MGFRFRKSVRLFPGTRLNISKSGFSVSVGGPGATFNFGPRGSSVTVGLPGSGLSYRHQFASPPRRSSPSPTLTTPETALEHIITPEPVTPVDAPQTGEIRSAEVARLSSPDLQGLKRMINEAEAERTALKPDLAAALAERGRAWRRLRRAEQPPLRMFLKNKTPQYRTLYEDAELEALKVLAAQAGTRIRIRTMLDDKTKLAYQAVRRAHAALGSAAFIWDVTASVTIDRYATRSAASNAVSRTPVTIGDASSDVMVDDVAGMRIGNANGGDIEIFPGFVLIREKRSTDYALIDLREVDVDYGPATFIEDDRVPFDTEVIGAAWEKSNKDGSPDRRFAQNRQIPIVRYGALWFSSRTGLQEAYYVSSDAKARDFAAAWSEFQAALRALASQPARPVSDFDMAESEIDLTKELPALPAVGGAHELTVAAALVVAAPAVFAVVSQPLQRQDFPVHTAVQSQPVDVRSAAERTPSATPAASPPAAAPMMPRSTTPTDSPRLQPTAPVPERKAPEIRTAPPISATVSPRRAVGRMLIARPANLRSEPNKNAAVVRTLTARQLLDVFSRNGDWTEVGVGAPQGWVHKSLLEEAR